MLWLLNEFIKFLKKLIFEYSNPGLNHVPGFFIMIRLFITIAIFTSSVSIHAEEYYIPHETVFALTSGIYYDNTEEINNFLTKNSLPIVKPRHVFYSGIQYKSNSTSLLNDKVYQYLYSFDIRVPFTRSIEIPDYSVELQSWSFFAELTTFESFIKTVTVHPILGMGVSNSNLSITRKKTNEGLFPGNGIYSSFDKFTLLFNVGGGCDYRLNIAKNKKETRNIIFSFEARYSIALDKLNMYNSSWTSGTKNIKEIPGYYAPGLSIEFKVGYEEQKNQ